MVSSLRITAGLVMASPFPTILLWGDDLVQIYNDGYRALMGVKHPRGLGQPTQHCWPEVWEINAPIYARVRAGETVSMKEALFPITRSGVLEDAWFTQGYSPLRNEAGAVSGVLVTVLETTAQVQAQRLEAERVRLIDELDATPSRLLREVFRQAPSFLAVYQGPTHIFALVNDAYCDLVGHGRDIIGKPLLDALPEVAGQGFDQLLDHVLLTGEPFIGLEVPVRVQRSAATELDDRVVTLKCLPLRNAAGATIGVIAHGTDVTEQVLARREVERLLILSEEARGEAATARDAAEAANRAKGEFLTIMSHELRTPLNAIAGYAELMQLGVRGPVTAQQVMDLGRIQRSQRHLLGLIDGVLNYARIERGHIHYDVSDVRIDEAIATCEALISPLAGAKHQTLDFAYCPPDAHVRGDREKIQQILVNLLSNAVKFTDPGGAVTLTCSLGSTAWPGVTLKVSDTGRGIPADQLERVFEPFVQVNSALTRINGGTGLGLAISRDFARGMGGDLTVESTMGEGSTFTFTLPSADVGVV